MKPIIESKRLFLRELKLSDTLELAEILSDKESMKYYPRPFSKVEVEKWIIRNIESYEEHKHGLWAVISKEDNIFLGDCGITIQAIDGDLLPELGYHIKRQYCNKGFASEAAKECIKYAFEILNLETLYSYTNIENEPSIRVAKKNGMEYIKSFEKKILGETVNEVLYSIGKQKNL
ncbi:MAG: GNAT family N-acetyltransferase [Candidatus Zophobacter franzmannii]|nr:GNAT family N-acetyltransferase [Candidatus Zophobacter franzmannii]